MAGRRVDGAIQALRLYADEDAADQFRARMMVPALLRCYGTVTPNGGITLLLESVHLVVAVAEFGLLSSYKRTE